MEVTIGIRDRSLREGQVAITSQYINLGKFEEKFAGGKAKIRFDGMQSYLFVYPVPMEDSEGKKPFIFGKQMVHKCNFRRHGIKTRICFADWDEANKRLVIKL
jgi:hypothetical protein